MPLDFLPSQCHQRSGGHGAGVAWRKKERKEKKRKEGKAIIEVQGHPVAGGEPDGDRGDGIEPVVGVVVHLDVPALQMTSQDISSGIRISADILRRLAGISFQVKRGL